MMWCGVLAANPIVTKSAAEREGFVAPIESSAQSEP